LGEGKLKFLKDLARIILKDELESLNKQLLEWQKQHSKALKELESINAKLEKCKLKTSLLSSELKECDERILEYFWNHKIRPLDKLYYPARNGNNMDVIRFFNSNNSEIPIINGESNDEKANNALKYVKNAIVYTADNKENWQWSNETLKRLAGDCEDGAILMANIMVKSGVPYWRIRLNAGDVMVANTARTGGHCWVTYFSDNNEWVVLDWCYYYRESVNLKNKWKTAERYLNTWFSWSSKYGFKKDTFDRE
jgi:predicted transglutaminase-like cysteine proteinase